MQIISAQPLVEKFQKGVFEDSEIGPYFMAYSILIVTLWIFAFGESNSWDTAAAIASVVITVFGILHLKNKNGESFGNQFLSKYFSLGWVITVRMLLLMIPAAVVLFSMAAIIGGVNAFGPASALFTILYEIIFYWWLGSLFSQSSLSTSE